MVKAFGPGDHAVIFRLNHCYSFFTGISKNSISHLQLIQSAAARVLTRSKSRSHHSGSQIFTLAVSRRIDFQILMLVFKGLNGFGPKYICDLLQCSEPSRSQSSSGSGLLSVPGVKTKHGEAAFSYYEPHI